MGLLAQIEQMAQAQALGVMGLVAEGAATLPDGVRTLVLLGPQGPGFWAHVTATPEFQDGTPDPLDSWSQRVISTLAAELGGQALFPFGTRPPHPFITWALASGRAFASPVHLLVHAQAGLWVSYRGAIGLPVALPALPPVPHPCTGCAQPCLSACPASALTPAGYDVPACHTWLDRAEGAACLTGGCAVRAICPVSRAHGRDPIQSAYHMRQFHR